MYLSYQSGHAPGTLGPIPSVHIPLEVLQKMFVYAALCPLEIAGLGTVTQEGADVLRITDAFILPQEVTMGSAKIKAEALHRHYHSQLEQGDDLATIRMQWHSHGNLPVYWSAIDEHNIERWRERGSYLVSIVLNRHSACTCRIDLFKPFRATFLEIPLRVEWQPHSKVAHACAMEIAAMVSRAETVLEASDAV